MAGANDHSELPEDTRELLADITEIGTVGESDLENQEEAFAEINEYAAGMFYLSMKSFSH